MQNTILDNALQMKWSRVEVKSSKSGHEFQGKDLSRVIQIQKSYKVLYKRTRSPKSETSGRCEPNSRFNPTKVITHSVESLVGASVHAHMCLTLPLRAR